MGKKTLKIMWQELLHLTQKTISKRKGYARWKLYQQLLLSITHDSYSYATLSLSLSLSLAFIPSIGMCRIRQFLAILWSVFHSSLLCTFSCHPSPPLFFHPLSPHLAIYFFVYLSILLFQNSYIIPFWEFYFLPFSVYSNFLFHCHILGLKFFNTLPFKYVQLLSISLLVHGHYQSTSKPFRF